MTRQLAYASIGITMALLYLATFAYQDHALTSQAKANAADEKDSVATQVKELQKQVIDLQTRVSELQKSRVIAAGTATWTRPNDLANKTSVRVKLPADVTAQLGKDYIVLLTNRFPQGGYPYFAPYWKVAADGFDATLVDSTLGDGNAASYDNPNKTYYIDWIVVKK